MGRILLGPGRRLIAAAAVAATCGVGATVSGCDSWGFLGACACTTDFRSYHVTVVDTDNQPVPDADVTVIRLRDGFEFPVGQNLVDRSGVYPILDDGHKDLIREIGDDVRIIISVGGVSVSADYFFMKDDCDCHIQLIQGPDTVELGGTRSL